jgi:hypothetical protein
MSEFIFYTAGIFTIGFVGGLLIGIIYQDYRQYCEKVDNEAFDKMVAATKRMNEVMKDD